MPSRILREGILDSDAVCSLTFPAEVFYRRLMSVVDDFGRFDGRSSVLRSRLYPLQIDKVREADIARWIAECVTAGLIALYAVDARPYILLHKADPPRSQTPKFPGPPTASPDTLGRSRLQPYTAVNGGTQPHTPVTYSGSDSSADSDAGSDSQDSSEPAKAPASKPAAADPPAGTVLTFPTVGKDARPWHLSAAQVADWQLAYPGVDVAADCRKALAWVLASPANTKTFGGMPRFLVKWLTRTTNAGTGRRPQPLGCIPAPAGETPMERTKRIHAQSVADKARKGDGDS